MSTAPSTHARLLDTAGRSVAAAVLLVCAVDAGTFQAVPMQRGEDAPLAELWSPPPAGRDLFFGVGGRNLQPDIRSVFTVMEIKARGFSDGYTVVDERHR